MIIDIPTPEEFESTGIYLLNLGWDIVSNLYLEVENSRLSEWDDGEVTNEFWQAAQQPLANALTLIQQGIEFLLKARISRTSPFLLIDGSPRDWPKKCDESDTPFSKFRTIDAQDLIRVCNTVQNQRLDITFCQRIEDLRCMRNVIMHSVDSHSQHSPNNLWEEVLEISHHLLGPQQWIEYRRKYLENTPSYIAHGGEEELMGHLSWECLRLLEMLQPADAKKFLNVNKKSRWYICHKCSVEIGSYEITPTTAQLRPNDPTSTTVYCFVCNEEEQVIRKDCIREDCRGNVIHFRDHICLTCYGEQA